MVRNFDTAVISHKPLISIITVVFNAKTELEFTINSVINQKYKNFEYIIVDGGSTDGTLEVIRKYNEKINFWISEPDNGIYDAMNKAVDKTNGKWIYFIGAGDILLNTLNKVASILLFDDVIYYGDTYRNDLSRIYGGKYSGFKLAVTNICHQGIFYPSHVFLVYRFNLKYKSLADHCLNMQCYGNNYLRFKYIPVLISIYEGNGYSGANSDFEFYKDKLEIIRKNFSVIIYIYACLRTSIAKLVKPNYLK